MRPSYSFLAFSVVCACPVVPQVYTGKLRLRVTDPSGLEVKGDNIFLRTLKSIQLVDKRG